MAKAKTRKLWPPKYYKGLSKTKKAQRAKEIKKFGSLSWRDPKAYVGFKTNIGVKTRKSSYTEQWNKRFPGVKSLEDKAKVTGIPLKFIKESYNRGLAAWRCSRAVKLPARLHPVRLRWSLRYAFRARGKHPQA